jgi:hypothetical protein
VRPDQRNPATTLLAISDQQDPPLTAQVVGESALDLLSALWRWLVLVAAIAVDTCLGVTLFVVLVLGVIRDKMHDVDVTPFTTTTTTPTHAGW